MRKREGNSERKTKIERQRKKGENDRDEKRKSERDK